MRDVTLRGGRVIGESKSPYYVAEVNSSHGGSEEVAKEMILAAKEAGCDCVKFQSWSADSLYSSEYYGQNPIAKRFVKRFSMTPEQLLRMHDFAKENGMDFSSTPYSYEEVDFLAGIDDVPYIKLSSMELNHTSFLKYTAGTGVPIILSTGMGTAEEVRRAVRVLVDSGCAQLCLLHCVSIYPCLPEMMRLKNILWLEREFPECAIGFSDHSLSTELSAAAVALGARVIEKHLTLDRGKIGMDNQMAIEPTGLAILVSQCENVFRSLGSEERIVCPEEMERRLSMRRSVVYMRDLPAGATLTEGDLGAKRPGIGLAPDKAGSLVGKKLARDVRKDTLADEGDFNSDPEV